MKHIRAVHTIEHNKCRHCKHVAQDWEALQIHLIDEHEDIVILHTMAAQVNNINEKIQTFEKVLKIVVEILLIRNYFLYETSNMN